jgi:hypothetical protein
MGEQDRSLCVRGVKLVRSKGAMRVPDNALKSVVYLGFKGKGIAFRAVGTGFFVSRQREEGVVLYLVTADHVARKLEKMKPTFAVRLNDANGVACELIPQGKPKWWRHPDDKTIDAAVFPWHLVSDRYPFSAFPSASFINADTRLRTLVGIGDDVYITGLFRKWAGKERISPIVRCGHIAMMDVEPISTTHYGEARFHFVEAMASSGLSGSPVFVEETLSIPMYQETPEAPAFLFGLGDTYLLGLVHGFLPLKVAEEIMGASEGQLWHSGICEVVPSEQILAILGQPKLIEYEDSILEKKPAVDTDKPIEAAIEEVPKRRRSRDVEVSEHPDKAKFFSDLGKAIQKREKK